MFADLQQQHKSYHNDSFLFGKAISAVHAAMKPAIFCYDMLSAWRHVKHLYQFDSLHDVLTAIEVM